jgi:hypothetical protein
MKSPLDLFELQFVSPLRHALRVYRENLFVGLAGAALFALGFSKYGQGGSIEGGSIAMVLEVVAAGIGIQAVLWALGIRLEILGTTSDPLPEPSISTASAPQAETKGGLTPVDLLAEMEKPTSDVSEQMLRHLEKISRDVKARPSQIDRLVPILEAELSALRTHATASELAVLNETLTALRAHIRELEERARKESGPGAVEGVVR